MGQSVARFQSTSTFSHLPIKQTFFAKNWLKFFLFVNSLTQQNLLYNIK